MEARCFEMPYDPMRSTDEATFVHVLMVFVYVCVCMFELHAVSDCVPSQHVFVSDLHQPRQHAAPFGCGG